MCKEGVTCFIRSYYRSGKGFTLLEMLTAMAILMVIIVVVFDSFGRLLTSTRRETKISESQLEELVNLEILKMDLESVGYGLPWSYPGALSNYQEADPGNVCGGSGVNPADFNDLPSQPPIALRGANNSCFNSSDYLVIKSINVARNETSEKWTYLENTGAHTWGSKDFESNQRLIVINPKASDLDSKRLMVAGGSFWTTYPVGGNWLPSEGQIRYIAYGIDPDTNPSVPFNRADYYISTSNVPADCAPGTGVLRKAVFSHSTHGFPPGNLLPLIDCVADFQVILGLDMNEDGQVGTYSNPAGSSLTSSEGASVADVQTTLNSARLLRKRLKEIRTYILTHEGKRDPNFSYPTNTVTVGDFGLGRNFDLTSIANYRNYRWRVINISAKPRNLE